MLAFVREVRSQSHPPWRHNFAARFQATRAASSRERGGIFYVCDVPTMLQNFLGKNSFLNSRIFWREESNACNLGLFFHQSGIVTMFTTVYTLIFRSVGCFTCFIRSTVQIDHSHSNVCLVRITHMLDVFLMVQGLCAPLPSHYATISLQSMSKQHAALFEFFFSCICPCLPVHDATHTTYRQECILGHAIYDASYHFTTCFSSYLRILPSHLTKLFAQACYTLLLLRTHRKAAQSHANLPRVMVVRNIAHWHMIVRGLLNLTFPACV